MSRFAVFRCQYDESVDLFESSEMNRLANHLSPSLCSFLCCSENCPGTSHAILDRNSLGPGNHAQHFRPERNTSCATPFFCRLFLKSDIFPYHGCANFTQLVDHISIAFSDEQKSSSPRRRLLPKLLTTNRWRGRWST